MKRKAPAKGSGMKPKLINYGRGVRPNIPIRGPRVTTGERNGPKRTR